MPWERDKHGGVERLPHKENGDCIYLEEQGCKLFGKPERPHACRMFDCREKLREWHNKGRPDLKENLLPVLWAAMKLTK